MRVSHLTLATPYQPGAIRRIGKPFFSGRGLAVHFVAEQVARVERIVERHAAGELLGDRQIQSATRIGLDGTRQPTSQDPRVVADRLGSAIDPIEHDLDGVLAETGLLQHRREGSAGPAGIPDEASGKGQAGAVVPGALQREVDLAARAILDVCQRQRQGMRDQAGNPHSPRGGEGIKATRYAVVRDLVECRGRGEPGVELLPD